MDNLDHAFQLGCGECRALWLRQRVRASWEVAFEALRGVEHILSETQPLSLYGALLGVFKMSSTEFGPASRLDAQVTQPADPTLDERADIAANAQATSAALGAVASDSAQPANEPALARKVGMYVIDSDVPMPDFKSQASRGRYPFGEMKVGESVVIHGVAEPTLDGARRSWLLRRGIDLQKVRVEGGFRVFRVA